MKEKKRETKTEGEEDECEERERRKREIKKRLEEGTTDRKQGMRKTR